MENVTRDGIVVRPAGEAGWAAVEAVLGSCADSRRCWCQRYKLAAGEAFGRFPAEERAHRLRAQTEDSGAGPEVTTTGLVAHVDGEPVGWCSVEPRTAFGGLIRVARVPWQGRTEDKADHGVWAVACFVTRPGHRRQGVASALAAATVGFARSAGARSIEGYPMTTTAALVGELHPGTLGMFTRAGFAEVSRPTPRRAVVRLEL